MYVQTKMWLPLYMGILCSCNDYTGLQPLYNKKILINNSVNLMFEQKCRKFTQIQLNQTKFTKIQFHNSSPQIQIHHFEVTISNSQNQIHKSKFTNSIPQIQIHRFKIIITFMASP